MIKSKLIFFILTLLYFKIHAQSTSAPVLKNEPVVAVKNKKVIKVDFANDLIIGERDVPDAAFMSSRKRVKFKELFNRRTNYIEEIDANKGVFNEYQK